MKENNTDLTLELKNLIIKAANLKDMQPTDIADHTSLYRDGLGLDSIDLLELIINIEKKYGLKLRNNDQGRQALQSVSSLAAVVAKYLELNSTAGR